MNKNAKTNTDNSTPYRNLGLNKVTAPNNAQNEPKSRVIKTDGDLRVKGGKK